MSEVIDISWPITSAMTTYKDKRDVALTQVKTFAQDGVCESKLSCGMHTGTHVDAPAHFIQQGKTLSEYPVNYLVGTAVVLDMTHVEEKITANELQKAVIPQDVRVVLLKTRNSTLATTAPFHADFIYLEQSGAMYLATLPLAGVGIDYLGIERAQPDHATHCTLLSRDILIIEGLRLAAVAPGRYHITCLPMLVFQSEAAPARAYLY